jgi:hypothetical protein
MTATLTVLRGSQESRNNPQPAVLTNADRVSSTVQPSTGARMCSIRMTPRLAKHVVRRKLKFSRDRSICTHCGRLSILPPYRFSRI